MKLRIRGDSVRLRLTQGEVRTLLDRGRIEERTHLGLRPEESLAYGIELSASQSFITCSWAKNHLVVLLPAQVAREWEVGSELGLEASQAVADGATLRILVEKDLACVTPRKGEDDGDAFPNPAGCRSRS